MTKIGSHYPMLNLNFAGLRNNNGKSVIVKSWNIVKGKRATVRYLSSGLQFIICWRETLSILNIFPTTPDLSPATKDFRSPNTMSSVTCSKGKLKFSSNLCGSPTSSG